MRRKTTLAVLDTPEGVQFVDVDTKSIKPHDVNQNLVEMKYLSGWKRSWGRGLPDKTVLKDFVTDKTRLYFYPTGTEDGTLRPERTTFIFGLMHKLNDRLTKENVSIDRRLCDQNKKHCEEILNKNNRIHELEFEVREIRRDFDKKAMELIAEKRKREWEMDKYEPKNPTQN